MNITMNGGASSHTPSNNTDMLISVVIPTLNEALCIITTLEVVVDRCSEPRLCEIILVDGGSTDPTLSLVQNSIPKLEKSGIKIYILTSECGRARQMNLGATHARGEILLFLHADTHLPSDFDHNIRVALTNNPQSLGAFSIATDSKNLPLRCICYCINLRSRLLSLPYGDQSLFIQRNFFIRMQMFPPIEIMEDFALVRHIKRHGGTIQLLPDSVTTSARRWHKRGYFYTTICNQMMILGYYLRIPTRILARWYRR